MLRIFYFFSRGWDESIIVLRNDELIEGGLAVFALG
jgi:hypothetical protein